MLHLSQALLSLFFKVLHTLRNNSDESTANASWRDESNLRASTEIAHLKETVLDLERRLADVSAQLAATSKDYELTKFALSEEKERWVSSRLFLLP
ncbi:unnamed protein product [Dibothriocephalus latus]|uniref:Uncharacterized protein n=1 Tax=Dibothriocephalus latus TaxID=60516 RepID=A0A3P7P1N3_DIBLA|nr:unnamed protein product [Dibothriocephalus latus]